MFKKVMDSKIQVGAQNCHESLTYGASTGSINSMMLKNVGAKYVILGHSENRQSGETAKLINLKIKSALKFGLKVIFCIGETLKERRKKITNQVLKKQIKLGLKNIKLKKNVIIAYEPVWSIGTGKIPNQEDLLKTTIHIKKVLKKIFKKKSPAVLYGGSVDENTIDMFRKIKEIDGFLIGGASQNSKNFIDIIKKTIN